MILSLTPRKIVSLYLQTFSSQANPSLYTPAEIKHSGGLSLSGRLFPPPLHFFRAAASSLLKCGPVEQPPGLPSLIRMEWNVIAEMHLWGEKGLLLESERSAEISVKSLESEVNQCSSDK